MKKRFISMLLIISLCSSLMYSQEEEIAIPYKPDEFPQWTVDLRRAEIVTIGSFPLSFMLTALIYDLSKSAASGFDPTVPFGSSRSQDDIRNMLIISGSVSLAIGLTDFIIHQVKRSKKEKEKQELDEQRKNNGESSGLSENES
jgi:hypothetical protein